MRDVKEKNTGPSVNIWKGIKKDIELGIITGAYETGNRFPSISQVAEMYGIGSTTAQKVLDMLCSENIIYKRQGVGYFLKPFVKDRLLVFHMKQLYGMYAETAKYSKQLGVGLDKACRILTDMWNNE